MSVRKYVFYGEGFRGWGCVIVFVSDQGFASPNSGRASNAKNIVIPWPKPRKRPPSQPSVNIPPFPVSLSQLNRARLLEITFQPPDSSSNTSSCNSSTPSSPAIQPSHTPHANVKSQFHFPGNFSSLVRIVRFVYSVLSRRSDVCRSVRGDLGDASFARSVQFASRIDRISTVEGEWSNRLRFGQYEYGFGSNARSCGFSGQSGVGYRDHYGRTSMAQAE